MKPQSMEEKISYRLFFMGFVGLVCTAVLCLFVFHKAFREQAWTSLEHQADLVSAGYEQLSSPDQLSVFVNGDLRITLIAADGSVVFESATDQQMENHLSRPEIQQAMREGVGRNCRDSQTMGYETYYYAMLLPGGDILRVAQDSETIWSIYDAALPAIILSCILMMGAAALIAGLLTRSLVQPILKMTDDLEHIQENVPYRELIPFAESIHFNTFLSIEPLLEDIDPGLGSFGGVRWIIVGAMTGPGSREHQPRREWLEKIVEAAALTGAKVFMKDSLKGVWGQELIREHPEGMVWPEG